MAIILMADSSANTASQITAALERLGHQVVARHSVEQATLWLKQALKLPSLIIVDVGIRAFKGLEFVQLLDETRAWQPIPVLAQTKSLNCELFEICEGVLRKPYSSRDLIYQVELLLGSAESPVPRTGKPAAA